MEPIGESVRSAQDKRERNLRIFKQFLLGAGALTLLSLDWWLIKTALFGGVGAGFWAWPVLASAAWIAAVSLFALVNPDRVSFFIVNALGLVAFLAIMPRDLYIFLGGLLFFVLSMWFQRRVQEEEKSQLNFSIRRTLGNSQAVATYALLILLGFMVYSSVDRDFRRDPDKFYQNLAETAVRGLPYLSQDRASYNLSQTVGDFFRRQAEQSYPEFRLVSAQQQQRLLEEIRDSFEAQFGIQADEQESLRAAMTQVVAQRLQEILGPYERFFPLVFTALVIALLRMFAFAFNWLVLLVSWLAFRLLLGLKFVRLVKQTVEVEKVDL